MSSDQICAVGESISCGFKTAQEKDPGICNDLIVRQQLIGSATSVSIFTLQTILRCFHQQLKDVVVAGWSNPHLVVISATINDTLNFVDDGLRELTTRRSHPENNGEDLSDEWEENGQIDDGIVGLFQELTKRIKEFIVRFTLAVDCRVECAFSNHLESI